MPEFKRGARLDLWHTVTMPEEMNIELLNAMLDAQATFEEPVEDAAFRRAYELFCPAVVSCAFCPGKADDFDHRRGCPKREYIPTRDARRGLVLAFSKDRR